MDESTQPTIEARRAPPVIATVVLAVLACIGIGVAAARAEFQHVLDPISFAWALPGMALGAAPLYWTLRLPKPAQHRNDARLVPLMLVVLLGTASYFGARWANAGLDDDPGEVYRTTVLERPQQKSAKKGRSEDYFLVVDPFLPEHEGQPVTFAVPKNVYRTIKIGEVLTLRVHDGALGYRWLEGL